MKKIGSILFLGGMILLVFFTGYQEFEFFVKNIGFWNTIIPTSSIFSIIIGYVINNIE